MTFIGKTIVSEESWEGIDDFIISYHHFLECSDKTIWHLMIEEDYDQYTRYKEIDLVNKQKIIDEFKFVKIC